MLHLQLGTDAQIFLTLSEKTTIHPPNYLFVAIHKTSKEKVKFVLKGVDDQSPAPSRLNWFNITVNTYFEDKNTGQYTYIVYEQGSDTNTEENLTGAVVEIGLLDLAPETPVSNYTVRETETSFNVRQ